MPVDSAAPRPEEASFAGPSRVKAPRHPLLDVGRPLGRVVRLALVFGAIAAVLLLRIPTCPVAIFTRHPCPGCGLTRATLALLRGDVSAAVHMHPLVFIITPVVVLTMAKHAYTYVRGDDALTHRRRPSGVENAAWIALGAAMILLWIARFLGAFGGPVPV